MTPLDALLDRPDTHTPPLRQAPAATHRVLIADDQSDTVAALRLLLGAHDIAVVAVATPGEALTIIKHQPIDAALVDLNFEKGRTTGEQGLELLSALLKQRPTLPVVVMTGWSSPDLVAEALSRGARDFVEKPWHEPRLVALMRSQAELGRALRRVTELEGEVRELRGNGTTSNGGSDSAALSTMRLLEVEGFLVRRAMDHHHGNVSRAARTLGLSRSALYRRLERHKI